MNGNWRDRAATTFQCEKQPATSSRGMVVSNHPLASSAGAEMLAAGGNAIDAAIATLFTLTVVEPMMVGIIGGGMAHIRLADGSLVALNTASAIRVVTSPEPVRLELVAGELLVTVPRKIVPLQLTSAHGQVALSDARVLVRRYDHGERVSVLDGQAHLSVNGVRDGLVLQAGWEAWLRRSEPMRPAAADTGRDAWTRGMLIADRMRLADVLAEMGRYRRGVLRCHPSIADLPVSGALPVRDSDRGLALLAASFPVSVRRVTDYWVSVEPVA